MAVVFNEVEVEPAEQTSTPATAQPNQEAAPKMQVRLVKLGDAQRRMKARAERIRAH